MSRRVLVTGAAGNLGRRLVPRLVARGDVHVVATDVRPLTGSAGVPFERVDVRDPDLAALLRRHAIDTIVHLAAILSPPPGTSRAQLHDVEVGGTENLLTAAAEAGVRRIVFTSSGAAYGYCADNAALLHEDAPLRATPSFPYAWHKREVEERLARWRTTHPALAQVVLRVSTVLGPDVHSPITDLFERPVVVGLSGVDAPFCFVDVEDVVSCLEAAALGDATGVFNVTGEGALTLREIATALGRPYLAVPERWLRRALRFAHDRGWTGRDEDDVLFLRHRPVLSAGRLQRELGLRPAPSREVFDAWRRART